MSIDSLITRDGIPIRRGLGFHQFVCGGLWIRCNKDSWNEGRGVDGLFVGPHLIVRYKNYSLNRL